MSSNPLDTIIGLVQKAISNAGLTLTPITVTVTVLAFALPFLGLVTLAYTNAETPEPPPTGCRKLGLPGPSNLSDQHSKKYSQGSDPTSSNPWTVKALFIYPLKSCKGIELDKSDVIRTGLRYDRQFCLGQQVTGLPSLEGKVESHWNVITLRSFPRMAKVETEIWVPDPSTPSYSADGEWTKSEGCLVIRFPFSPDTDFSLQGFRAYGRILAARWSGTSEPMIEFRVPFNPTRDRMKKMGYTSQKLTIFGDAPEALNLSTEIPEDVLDKLRYALGMTNPLSLFRIDTEKYREVHSNAPKKEDVGFQTIVGMPDSHPMHILNLASIHDISSHQPKSYRPLNALRFRANIYVTGPPAFSEDDWKAAQIGDSTYDISCRTTRCKLPNVDPETGNADRNQPSTTMLKYRVIDEGSKAACLGMMMTPLGDGEVRVGDEVKVLEKGKHFFVK